MKITRSKAIELLILFACTVFLLKIVYSSVTAKEESIVGDLVDYRCSLWKETSLIYTHEIDLENGKSYSIRTKNINCELSNPPTIGKRVKVIVENSKLLELVQNGENILDYNILKEDSHGSKTTVVVLLVLFALGTIWSLYGMVKKSN